MAELLEPFPANLEYLKICIDSREISSEAMEIIKKTQMKRTDCGLKKIILKNLTDWHVDQGLVSESSRKTISGYLDNEKWLHAFCLLVDESYNADITVPVTPSKWRDCGRYFYFDEGKWRFVSKSETPDELVSMNSIPWNKLIQLNDAKLSGIPSIRKLGVMQINNVGLFHKKKSNDLFVWIDGKECYLRKFNTKKAAIDYVSRNNKLYDISKGEYTVKKFVVCLLDSLVRYDDVSADIIAVKRGKTYYSIHQIDKNQPKKLINETEKIKKNIISYVFEIKDIVISKYCDSLTDSDKQWLLDFRETYAARIDDNNTCELRYDQCVSELI